jgi:hypothetical protein
VTDLGGLGVDEGELLGMVDLLRPSPGAGLRSAPCRANQALHGQARGPTLHSIPGEAAFQMMPAERTVQGTTHTDTLPFGMAPR